MIERADFVRVYSFQDLGFDPVSVNGLSCRFADAKVSLDAMKNLIQEFPELRAEDYCEFEFAVDWVGHEVEVREKDMV